MKAIIVIDLLEEYNLDDLNAYVEVSFKDNGQILCGLFNKELKPMPQRRYSLECGDSDGNRWKEPSEYDNGYNACIDEILGEEENA